MQHSDSLPRVLRSEVTKLLALRSTRWTLLAQLVATVGLGALASLRASDSVAVRFFASPSYLTGVTLSGLVLGALAMAVLGALTVSGEWSSGAARATFTAVPRRWRVLVCKALVVAVVAFLAGLASSVAAFVAGTAVLGRDGGPTASLGDPGVLRGLLGGGLYVLGCGLFGVAVGALLRRTAGAVTTVVAALFVLPGLTTLLPDPWGPVVRDVFTTNPARVLLGLGAGNRFGAWSGYGVFTAWWVVLGASGFAALRRRDV